MTKVIKYYLIILLLLSISNTSFAKQNANESLLNAPNISGNDSKKVDTLIGLAKENTNANFLKYINEALSLAEKINYKEGIVSCAR